MKLIGTIATLVAYFALLWLGTSIIPGKGLVAFAVGVTATVWSVWKAKRGDRRPAQWMGLVVVAWGLAVLVLECALLICPSLVSGRLANYVFGGFHIDHGGIYRVDPWLGKRMKAGFRRRLFWNGHWWTHETNADGYRGPHLSRADAVFLGDSMVYGHGVEGGETLPAQFGRISSLATANLGQPGIGAIEELALFEDVGSRLGPHRVFVCVHPNDAYDSLDAYPLQELERFVSRPTYRPTVRQELRGIAVGGVFDWWASHMAVPLRSARLVAGLRGKPDWVFRVPGRNRDALDVPYVPSPDAVVAQYPPLHEKATAPLGIAWRANQQALAELRRIVPNELVLFDLGYPREFSEAVQSLARDLGAKYSAAGRVALARALAGEHVFLPGDGHWAPRGCEIVAHELVNRGD